MLRSGLLVHLLKFRSCQLDCFCQDRQRYGGDLASGNEVGPLRLTGPSVAGIIPWVCRGVLGDERWIADPRIAPLLT